MHDAFSGHEMGKIFRERIPGIIRAETDLPANCIVKGSVGQGSWAVVPWIAIMDERITTTTRNGVYIIYLLTEFCGGGGYSFALH